MNDDYSRTDSTNSLESESKEEIVNEPENNIILELRDLPVRMHSLVDDVTAIDKAIEVSKYVLKYNCRPP